MAATQFTAYMAMSNVAISCTSWWQGNAIGRWGYPVTLAVDAAVGLIVVFLLPFMRPAAQSASSAPFTTSGVSAAEHSSRNR